MIFLSTLQRKDSVGLSGQALRLVTKTARKNDSDTATIQGMSKPVAGMSTRMVLRHRK